MADGKSRIDMSLDTIIKLNRNRGGSSGSRRKVGQRTNKFERRGSTRGKSRGQLSRTNINSIGKSRRLRPIENPRFSESKIKRSEKGRGRRRYGNPIVTESSKPAAKLFQNALKEPGQPSRSKSGNSERIPISLTTKKNAGWKTLNVKKAPANRNTIKTTDSGQLKIFTKNFDARTRIEAKRNKDKGAAGQRLENVRQSNKEELSISREDKRKNLVLTRRNFVKNEVSAFQEDNQQFSQKGKTTKNETLSSRFNQGDSIHFKNRSAGTVVTCEYDEPLLKFERTIRQQLDINEDRTLVHAARNNKRTGDLQADSYATPLQTVKRKQSVTVQKQNLNKVVINNLHPNVTTDDIRELFGAVGDFLSAGLLHPGMAEVIYEYPDDAILAYKKYHSRNLDGQPMICKLMSTAETVSYQPALRTKEATTSRPSAKPVIFTVKI